MLEKRHLLRVFLLTGSLVLTSGLAQATVLYQNDVTILSTDPTQLGRLSRNGIIADWSFLEPFPGTINTTTSYHYEAIAVQVPYWLSFLQVTIDSNNINIFASLYDTSYNPNSTPPNNGLDVNYMGDEGGSGNFFGTSPRFFQVVDQTALNSPTGFGTVVVVLNESVTNGGLNDPVNVLVEGFSDTDFDEVPEPATVSMLGAGILILAARYCRRTQPAL